MPELSIPSIAAVVERLPMPVLLTTESGAVVAASPATHAWLGTIEPGTSLEQLVSGLASAPSLTHHHVETDGDAPHVLVTIEDAPDAVPADVAALARATAHDFNNLLGVIINFASLAATQVPDGSSAAQDLQEVLVASRRAATLTQRLLQLASATSDDETN